MYTNKLTLQPEERGAALLCTKEAARLLSVHHNTLCKWRIRGVGPCFIKAGTTVRYRRSDIETWLQNRTYENTTAYRAGNDCRPR
jgi:excisionase family DNA binding protein